MPFELTENYQHENRRREAGHQIEHELQIAADQRQVIVVAHQNRWHNETNCDTQLKWNREFITLKVRTR